MSSEDPGKARAKEDARIKRPPSEFSHPLPRPDFTVIDPGEFFASRPLLPGESASLYDELLAKAKAAVQPTDVVEMIWVRNAVDLIWDAQRLRRLKTHLLKEARTRAVVASLALEAKLMARWQTGDPDARAAVEAKFAAQGLSWDAVTAQVLLSNLTEFERLERLIASADGRWERALTNIARRRDGLAQELRRVAEAATANRHVVDR